MICQAIVTKYFGPRDVRGSRIKASAFAGSIIRMCDDALTNEQNHNAAAKQLAEKMQWNGTWFGGALPPIQGNFGNVYVCSSYVANPSFVVSKGTLPPNRFGAL